MLYLIAIQVTILETYPQIIGYDPAVFNFFKEQYVSMSAQTLALTHRRTFSRSHLCGFDLNLTYPQDGPFPTLSFRVPPSFDSEKRALRKSLVRSALKSGLFFPSSSAVARDVTAGESGAGLRESQKQRFSRDLTGRANGTIDPFYGCDLIDEAGVYALNFSIPWSECHRGRLHCYALTLRHRGA